MRDDKNKAVLNKQWSDGRRQNDNSATYLKDFKDSSFRVKKLESKRIIPEDLQLV